MYLDTISLGWREYLPKCKPHLNFLVNTYNFDCIIYIVYLQNYYNYIRNRSTNVVPNKRHTNLVKSHILLSLIKYIKESKPIFQTKYVIKYIFYGRFVDIDSVL
jgi:hypothetical protein